MLQLWRRLASTRQTRLTTALHATEAKAILRWPSLARRAGHRWLARLPQRVAALSPGVVVDRLHRAVRVERQAGQDLDPLAHPGRLDGQIQVDREEPSTPVVASGRDGPAI